MKKNPFAGLVLLVGMLLTGANGLPKEVANKNLTFLKIWYMRSIQNK